jgi:mannitol/fructose-specific phosphotransferase system IIA component (Ntr-type)
MKAQREDCYDIAAVSDSTLTGLRPSRRDPSDNRRRCHRNSDICFAREYPERIFETMKMADLINERNIDLSLSADSELETIMSMVDLASHCDKVEDTGELAQAILHYEVMAPSFTGSCGVVFHAVTDGVFAPKIFFGRFDKGIGYHSKTGRPLDLVFLVAAPSEQKDELADIFLKLDQMLQKQSTRELLRSSKRPDEILEAVIKHLDWKEETADADQAMVNTH